MLCLNDMQIQSISLSFFEKYIASGSGVFPVIGGNIRVRWCVVSFCVCLIFCDLVYSAFGEVLFKQVNPEYYLLSCCLCTMSGLCTLAD